MITSHDMKNKTYSSLNNFLLELNEHCLLLARHGETDWNANNIIQGQQDRPLNQNGFNQRKNLFHLLNPVPLQRIVCSALERTIQTATPIAIEKNIEIEKMSGLNEVKLGIFEGLHKDVFADEHSADCYKAFLADEVNTILPGGGENLIMVDKRVYPILENCLQSVLYSGHVLVVGHRNVNKMIVKNIMGLSLADGYQVEHQNNWLYIFAPKIGQLFLVKILAPTEPIEVQTGYQRI